MLLTITTTHQPADELGFLLHKNPARTQVFDLPVGRAHVFYPDVTPERCTAALLLEVDPIGLVRNRNFKTDGFALGQYVNDRPYAASSLLSVAIKDVFRTALTGRCTARPELAAAAIPLEITVPAVPCHGGAELVRRLFEPLGWTVSTRTEPLDPQVPVWGDSRYVDLRLSGTLRLAAALNHLYVLLPGLGHKRSLAQREYVLGLEALDRLARGEPLWRVHECVFAVLALESEPVDPRL